MVKVAVIGAGYIGKVHLETLLRIPGVEVKALVDANVAFAQELAERYRVNQVTGNYQELLNDPEIMVYHNCTPNHLHFEINKTLIEAGKHVLSEKPLSITCGQAEILKGLAVAKDVVTGVNFCYRYYPAVQEAAARIQAGNIGKIRTIMGSYLQDWLLFDTDYSWRLDKAISGASNTVADIGSHWCDLAQFVSGAKITEVMADLKTLIPVRKKSRHAGLTFSKNKNEGKYMEVPVEVDDYASVLVHFDNGACGAFTVCQLAAGRKCTIDLQIYGSESSLAWNHEHPNQLWIGHRDSTNEILIENPLQQMESTKHYALLPAGHPLGYHDAVYNLFNDFYRAISSKEKNCAVDYQWPDFTDGYREMKIVEAVLQSHAEKRWVKVES
jgi:predicted dehydrogenase